MITVFDTKITGKFTHGVIKTAIELTIYQGEVCSVVIHNFIVVGEKTYHATHEPIFHVRIDSK